MKSPQLSTVMVWLLAGVVTANVAAAEPGRGDRRTPRGPWFNKLDRGLQRAIDSESTPGERPPPRHHPHPRRRRPARLGRVRPADREEQGQRRVRAVAGRRRAGGGEGPGPRAAGGAARRRGHLGRRAGEGAPVGDRRVLDVGHRLRHGLQRCGLAVLRHARRDGLPQHELGRLGRRRRGDRLRRGVERRPPHHGLLRLPHRHRPAGLALRRLRPRHAHRRSDRVVGLALEGLLPGRRARREDHLAARARQQRRAATPAT